MCAEPADNEARPSPKPDAESVIAKAIAAMREDPLAHAAADAIEGAWGSRGFDVERAVHEIDVADDNETEEP